MAHTKLMLTSEAARLAGVSAATIRNWTRTGRLRSVTTGNGVRLLARKDVVRLAAEREKKA